MLLPTPLIRACYLGNPGVSPIVGLQSGKIVAVIHPRNFGPNWLDVGKRWPLGLEKSEHHHELSWRAAFRLLPSLHILEGQAQHIP